MSSMASTWVQTATALLLAAKITPTDTTTGQKQPQFFYNEVSNLVEETDDQIITLKII